MGCIVVTATAVHAEFPGEKDRQYLNIALPMPEATFGSPIVIRASPQETVFARLNYVTAGGSLLPPRDAQVLAGVKGDWRFLGSNGNRVSGVGGTFLSAAVQGPDEQLWLLLTYTRPSNPQRGDSDYLYRLHAGSWELASGPDWTDIHIYQCGGLHFVGSPNPMRVFRPLEPHKPPTSNVYGFQNGRWKILDIASELPSGLGRWAWRRTDAFYIVEKLSGKQATRVLTAYYAANWFSLSKPIDVLSVSEQERLQLAAVSAQDELAVVLRDVGTKAYIVCLTQIKENGKMMVSTVQRFQAPPGIPTNLSWSPNGELHICCFTMRCGLDVYKLVSEGWISVGHHRQDLSRGYILEPKMTFRTDGVPIVVWDDFRPTD
jgi:hypothetical protein